MKTAFAWMVIASVFCGAANGSLGGMGAAAASAGERAVSLGMVLCGTMMTWCGLTEILRDTGDDVRLSRIFRRMLKPLFPGLTDPDAWKAVCMNLSANMLGLGNAATPCGIEAARLLTRPENGQNGLNALAMLLVINNSGVQLIPSTVIAMRSAAGSSSPAGIWWAEAASSGAATVAAVALLLIIRKGEAMWKTRRPS